jgi:hypothetical protein
VVAVALFATACSASGLAFRASDAVEIVSPRNRTEVRLPVRLSWRAPNAGAFYAAFVDRAPIRPGQSLDVLADDDCRRVPRCPDLQYLRDRYVFVTDGDSLVVDAVPQKTGTQRASARHRHEATIVPLDADGRRVGESAYTVEFTVVAE